MDCNLPGFSVHGILQARTLEWVAISFSTKIVYLTHINIYSILVPGIEQISQYYRFLQCWLFSKKITKHVKTIQLRSWVSMGEISQMRVLQYRYYISWIHLKKVQPTCKIWGKDHLIYKVPSWRFTFPKHKSILTYYGWKYFKSQYHTFIIVLFLYPGFLLKVQLFRMCLKLWISFYKMGIR